MNDISSFLYFVLIKIQNPMIYSIMENIYMSINVVKKYEKKYE